ncbi:MAG: hypothetical protein WB952_11430 [Terriglobales bacterium]
MRSRIGLIVVFLSFSLALPAQAPPSSSTKPSSSASAATPDPGAISNNVYGNAFFGFSYRLPFGWVDRTDDMRQDPAESAKSMVLLGIFERPPQATGNTLNSAVVIAVESASAYPGLKAAVQYFGPLTEVATAKGLKAVNEPYEFPVDAKPIVRRDYAGQVRGLAVQQSTLVLLEKNYVVSFTFIASNNDEMIELIEGLRFGKLRNPPGK